ncbi:MAG TPA: nucleotidyltransferase domain-containing protein [Gemmatimonadales bacterium]|nr:nucleotidyltransferase domain-containing protein [Gemmatimonadales bacterium]
MAPIWRLLLKSNPNIVGLLWLREEDYVYRHPVFEWLRGDRRVFSSQAAAEAFAGYAWGQLQRMEAFDLERMTEYEMLTATIREHGPIIEVLEADAAKLLHIARSWRMELETLKRFRKLHRAHFSGYMGEKRKRMVRKYRYDVKNAAHLIRLLRMGAEFLETGELRVHRAVDGEELKAIKRGAWTLDEVKAEAGRLFAAVEEARARSPLPVRPDAAAANALLLRMHREWLGVSAP